MGANMQYGLLLLAYSGIMFLCLTLCLYLIKDTDISLTIGVIATLLILLGIAKIFQSKEEKQESCQRKSSDTRKIICDPASMMHFIKM